MLRPSSSSLAEDGKLLAEEEEFVNYSFSSDNELKNDNYLINDKEINNDLSKNRFDILDSNRISAVELKYLLTPGEIKLLETIKGSAKQTMYGATLAFFSGLSASTLYSPIMNTLNKHLNYSAVNKQIVNASPNLTGSLLRIPSALLLEKYSSKKIHLILLILTFIGLIPIVIINMTMYPSHYESNSDILFYVFILCGLISGSGGATFSCGIPTVGYWYPKSLQGYSLGFYGGFGNCSPGIMNILMPNISKIINIPGMYLLWLMWLGWSIYVSYDKIEDNPFTQLQLKHNKLMVLHPEWNLPKFNINRCKLITSKKYKLEIFPIGSIYKSMIGSIKTVPCVLLIITYMVSFGGYLGLIIYLPTYWNTAFNFGEAYSGLCTFAYAILTSSLRYYGGVLSDLYGGILIGYISIISSLICCFILFVSYNFVISFLSIILLGISTGIFNGSHFKIVPLVCGNYLSGASAWIGCIGATGGFYLPIIMAKIASIYNHNSKLYFQMPWLLMIFLWILALILWFILQRYVPKRVKINVNLQYQNVDR